MWQKNPMHMAKEPHVYGKRAPCTWQNSPYVHGKRGLSASAYLLFRRFELPQLREEAGKVVAFSKVSALVHLLYESTIQSTFENVCKKSSPSEYHTQICYKHKSNLLYSQTYLNTPNITYITQHILHNNI